MSETENTDDETRPLVEGNVPKTEHRGLLNPRGPYLRWIAVFFMCFLSFGK